MATPGDSQYVSTTSDLSTVREFVAGFQARNAASTKASLKGLAVGIVATAALTGRSRQKSTSRKHRS